MFNRSSFDPPRRHLLKIWTKNPQGWLNWLKGWVEQHVLNRSSVRSPKAPFIENLNQNFDPPRRHLLKFEPKFKPARVAQLVKRVGWTTCPQQVECSIPQGAIYFTKPKFKPARVAQLVKRVGWTTCPQQVECSIPQGAIYSKFEPKLFLTPARVAQLVKRVGWTTCPQQVECSIPQGAIYLTLNFKPARVAQLVKRVGWTTCPQQVECSIPQGAIY